jgi:hypothetical protein
MRLCWRRYKCCDDIRRTARPDQAVPAFRATLEDPRLRRFYDYWRSKCDGDRLPGRRDIDPLDLPDLLPLITILDIVAAGDGARFRFRLVGTANVAVAGREYTGSFIEDVFEPEDAARMTASCRAIVERREPHYWVNLAAVRGNPPVRYARLMVPLASDGVSVDMLMGLFLFTGLPRRASGRGRPAALSRVTPPCGDA